VLDTSVFVKGNMGQREYNFSVYNIKYKVPVRFFPVICSKRPKIAMQDYECPYQMQIRYILQIRKTLSADRGAY
jgi:hypothetical protein